MNNSKQTVRDYWNRKACGSDDSNAEKLSQRYLDEIETARYLSQPEIFSFAQFTRHRGKKVLEAGVGAGADFIQWMRAGADAFGVDLTEEAAVHTKRRLAGEGFPAGRISVADIENLPFSDGSFDLVWSWGVIHHSPDMEQALGELARVARPGGELRIMVYHRRSVYALLVHVQRSILRGRLFGGIARTLAGHMESPGTKAYTFGEMREIARRLNLEVQAIEAPVMKADLLWKRPRIQRMAAYVLHCLRGFDRSGWNLMVKLRKPESRDVQTKS